MNESKKNLLGSDLLELLVAGFRPVIRFNKGIKDIEEGPDEGLMAKVVGYNTDDNLDCVVVMCDLKPYEKYNEGIMVADWFDKRDIACLKWNQTPYYPENGVYVFYADYNYPLKFDIVEEFPFFGEYKESNSKLSYIEWLEEQLDKARTANHSDKKV